MKMKYAVMAESAEEYTKEVVAIHFRLEISNNAIIVLKVQI